MRGARGGLRGVAVQMMLGYAVIAHLHCSTCELLIQFRHRKLLLVRKHEKIGVGTCMFSSARHGNVRQRRASAHSR
ncbi:hypothetical protein B0T25DRAFT_529527 [Lasiosphaeria hispida]|uniref:Secreted protein n=1 Tax=Lasiosphaeria hispida TaxID=260671 RepID=A0AAJ0HWH8_9PEZI|nr:hypothetical protein B0T25DRAFT_529527 [Lasiosphaeria hispida]